MNKNTHHFTDQEIEILKNKNRFLIEDDMFDDIKMLKDSDVVLLMYSVFEYVTDGILPELDDENQIHLRIIFNRFKKQHDSNLREWLDGRMKKITAGRKGGLAKRKVSTA